MGLKRARLSAVALGVAIGFLKGGWMLALCLSVMHGSAGKELVALWTGFYPGVDETMKGAFMAAAWGFLCGFFGGLILGWIYNLCLCCCNRSHCNCCKTSCDTCNPVIVEKK